MPGTDHIPPSVTRALEPFGLAAGSAEVLSGYVDEGYAIDTSEGRYVLKIAPPDTPVVVIDLETAVVDRVLARQPDLPVPAYRRTVAGTAFETVEIGGVPRHVRLMEYVSGVHYAEFRPHTPSLREQLGRVLGQLDEALLTFEHPGMNRYFEWDLARALDVASITRDIESSSRRRRVDDIFDTLKTQVAPLLADLRCSVIHSDANDFNLLVDCRPDDGSPRITGLLDFGDTVLSHTINELAITCAYAMLDQNDPVAAACDVVRGYHKELPLTEHELEVLYPLVRARLAVSATLSARWRSRNPEISTDTYHTISESAVWNLLDRLEYVNPRFSHYAFRDACGLEACPQTPMVVQYLESRDPAAVIAGGPPSSRVCFIDLSVGSRQQAARHPEANVAQWSRRVHDQIREAGAEVGVGRYGEARACYTASQFETDGGEQRTVHLGVDLFVPHGTDVFAPLDGIVHSLDDNDIPLDYGPTVIVEHAPTDGPRFYSLYGHLSRQSLESIRPGQPIRPGERIGGVGRSDENGGWPPHLHFQLITDMLGLQGNFPGVAQPSARRLWKSLCPDPSRVLRISRDAFQEQTMSTEQVMTLRQRYIGNNLSLSYRLPLHIVRGRGQFLFDVDGRRFLDCVNNVAHVGHEHPRVVTAIAEQAAVLNTNTRYLHENLVRYAQRLAATLPEPLSVCYFVNSGSEANDLALRIARVQTEGNDFLVLGSAYHGNLSSLIDVSPYKSRGPGGIGPPRHVHELAAPDMYRGPHADSADPERARSEEMENVLHSIREGGGRLAAFIAESAPSCAGQILLPEGFLSAMYDAVRHEGGICIADEVQVGFGRVGSHFWAFETQGVVPDIVTMGKPIGNGHPLGAVVTTRKIADSFANGMEYFNTFGGNPVSCAAGLAVLDIIRDERLQDHALRVGRALLDELRTLARDHPCIGDVRGSGLFIGIEIVHPGSRDPDSSVADYVVNRMRECGVLLSTDGPDHNVIKIKPPMVFNEEDVRFLVTGLGRVLGETFVRGRASRPTADSG